MENGLWLTPQAVLTSKQCGETQEATQAKGCHYYRKEVSFDFADAGGNAIEGVELYLEDNPSSYAKMRYFLRAKTMLIKLTLIVQVLEVRWMLMGI